MKLYLEIKSADDAFTGGNECNEVARILRDLIRRIERDDTDSIAETIVHGGRVILRDVNGNRCGVLRVA